MATGRNSVRPSWKGGFARSAAESEAPAQWDGLIAAWAPFLGNQGSTLYDLSGRDQHGTLSGPIWVSSQRGVSMELDGVDDIVTTLCTASPTLSTVMAWAYPQTYGGNTYGGVLRKDSFAKLRLEADQVGDFCWVWDRDFSAGQGRWFTPQDSAPLNVWQHVAAVHDASSSANAPLMYINGVNRTVRLEGGQSGTANSNGNAWIIGKGWNDTSIFDGYLDDLRIYDRLLSNTEILDIYKDSFAMYRLHRRRVYAVTAAGAALVRAVTETVQVDETLARFLALRRTVTEDVNLTEGLHRALGLTRVVTEGENTSESLARKLGLVRGVAEGVQTTETTPRLKAMLREVVEDIEISTTRGRFLGFSRGIVEGVQVGESRTSFKGLSRSVAEGLQLSESLSRALGLTRSVTETVQTAETVPRFRSLSRSVYEVVSISTSASHLKALVKSVIETVGVTTTVYRFLGFTRTATEDVQVSESTARFAGFARSVMEGVQVVTRVAKVVAASVGGVGDNRKKGVKWYRHWS